MSTGRLLIIVCALSLALAVACKNGGGGPKATETPAASPTPAGTTVTSDDGKLSLFIPEGAMPAGTDVSITAVAHDQLPVELQELAGSGTGYRLEPDGLTFSTPATAILTIDRAELDDPADQQATYALVSFSAAASREVLDSHTTWSVEGNEITVEAQLEHFSMITRTKGSISVSLARHRPERAIGERYLLEVQIFNLRPEQVTLENLGGTWLRSGVITVEGEVINTEEFRLFYPAYFNCTAAGTGTNGVNVRGVSRLVASPTITTNLRFTIERPVRCVAGTPAPEEAREPSPTPATARPVVHLEQTIGCEHTQPGVESELRKRGRITDEFGRAIGGATVFEEASGPGLIDEELGPRPVVFASDTTDANGEFELSWVIVRGGPYTTEVTRVQVGQRDATLDGTSTNSSEYTVASVCTPP